MIDFTEVGSVTCWLSSVIGRFPDIRAGISWSFRENESSKYGQFDDCLNPQILF
jgi:hypothetical protein